MQQSAASSSSCNSRTDLVVYQPDMLLHAFAARWRRVSFKERKRANELIGNCTTVAEALYSTLPGKRRIIELRRRIRLVTRGVAQTELMDEESLIHSKTHELTQAEQLLLKRAYRYARTLMHPDKGGSIEDFQSLHAAYVAKDLAAVQEFVLHLDKSVTQQAGYWLVQTQRPAIQWAEYKASPEYVLVRWIHSGRTEEAIALATRLLAQSEQHLQLQLIAVLARKYEENHPYTDD